MLAALNWLNPVLGLLPPVYVRMTGGYVFTGVCLFRGGVPGLRFLGGGGVQGLIFSGGGVPRSQIFWGVPGLRFREGGPQVSDFQRGSQVSDFQGGVPGFSKGKNF